MFSGLIDRRKSVVIALIIAVFVMVIAGNVNAAAPSTPELKPNLVYGRI